MSARPTPDESTVADQWLHILDVIGRMAVAVEDGHWITTWGLTHDLQAVTERLGATLLDLTRVERPTPGGVRAVITRESAHHWAARAVHERDNR